MKFHLPLLGIATAALLPLTSHADDVAMSPFALRFPTAFGHLSFYGDVSAKSGASAASKWESSPNPANKAWGFPDEYDYRVSGQYNNVEFDNGTVFHVTTETAAFDTGAAGVFRLGLIHINSNERIARGAVPLPYEFDLNGAQLSWAKKLSKEFALGAEVGFTHGETAFKLPTFDLANTDKEAWSFRLGGLWSPTESKWFFALYGDYVNGASDTTLMLPTPFGIAQLKTSETVQQFLVHPGIGYEFAENAMIHADYEAGWIFNDTDSLQVQRVAVGTDIKVARFFYLRAGASVDSESNVSWSTGLGFYPSKHLFIDLAYQNNSFPELKQEFGRSRTLNFSFSIQW